MENLRRTWECTAFPMRPAEGERKKQHIVYIPNLFIESGLVQAAQLGKKN